MVHLLLILRIIHYNKFSLSMSWLSFSSIFYWLAHYVDCRDSYLTVPTRLVRSCATLVSTLACAVVYFWFLFNSSIIRCSLINSNFCENWWTSTCTIMYLCWLNYLWRAEAVIIFLAMEANGILREHQKMLKFVDFSRCGEYLLTNFYMLP